MSYLPKKRAQPGALGGLTDVAGTVRDVALDPCLFTVAGLVNRIGDGLPSSSGPSTGPKSPGIGLCHAVKPLSAVAYVVERPWVLPLGVAAVVGVLVGIGYTLGRDR